MRVECRRAWSYIWNASEIYLSFISHRWCREKDRNALPIFKYSLHNMYVTRTWTQQGETGAICRIDATIIPINTSFSGSILRDFKNKCLPAAPLNGSLSWYTCCSTSSVVDALSCLLVKGFRAYPHSILFLKAISSSKDWTASMLARGSFSISAKRTPSWGKTKRA